MHLQDGFPPANIRQVDCDLPIETARAQQCRVQNIGSVRGGDNDNAFLCVKAIHLDEQGIKRLLAFVISATQSMAAAASHRVNFINENKARGVLARLFEHVAHTTSPYAHKHFDEIRTTNTEESRI